MAAFNTPGAGSLRERVRFDLRQTVSTEMGDTIGPWVTVLSNIPAKITPTRGGEIVQQAKLDGLAYSNVLVSSTTDTRAITNAHRIVNERTGVTYKIQYVENPDERNRWLVMTVRTGGADG